MKEEIKEILEALKPHDKEFTEAGIKEYPLVLSVKEQKILSDYITNLQKTQEMLIKNDNEIITNLQQENEKLKEIIKDNTILVKDENENYQECNINPLDYKQRIEKAIENIEHLDNVFIDSEKQDNILNILKGDKDE